MDQLMRSIRDVAVFAWALAGINGNVAAYGRGLPTAESQLPGSKTETRTPNSARDPWGGRPDPEEIEPQQDDDNGDRLSNPLRIPAASAASDQGIGGPRHRDRGPLSLPPSQPRQHPRSLLNPPSTREQGTCNPSSWTDFTDAANRGPPDGRNSYGVTTSQPDSFESCKRRHFGWP